MHHTVEDLCEKISVMYDKSYNLRRENEMIPELKNYKKIKYLIDDIKMLAADIVNDKGYPDFTKEK